MYAKCGQLVLYFGGGCSDPNTVSAIDAPGCDPEIPASANHHFLELLDVPANIPAVLREVNNRVADDLPRPVIGDIPTAVARMEFHIHLLEQVVPGAQMLLLAIAP